MLLCACATTPSPSPKQDERGAPTRASGTVQNATGDEDLTAIAEDALRTELSRNGIDPAAFELVARLEPDGDGLQVTILCSTRSDHLLKSHVNVKAHGPRKKLVPSMMAKAARDLSADCR